MDRTNKKKGNGGPAEINNKWEWYGRKKKYDGQGDGRRTVKERRTYCGKEKKGTREPKKSS